MNGRKEKRPSGLRVSRVLIITMALAFFSNAKSDPVDWLSGSCNSYVPRDCYNVSANCLPHLKISPSYDVCKNKSNICFIIMEDAGIVNWKSENFENANSHIGFHEPVRCKDFTKRDGTGPISGAAFDLFEMTSAGGEYCVPVGSSTCRHTDLIHFIEAYANEYQFAIGNPIIESPQQKCLHSESGTWLDGNMVIVGRTDDSVRAGFAFLLIYPFHSNTWIFLIVVVVLLMGLTIATFRNIHRHSKKAVYTSFLYLVGEYDRACDIEQERVNDKSSRISGNERLTKKYTFISSLLRFSWICFFAVFFMFFEAVVVNDLLDRQGQLKTQFDKKLKNIKHAEHEKYCIAKGSILSFVWEEKGKLKLLCLVELKLIDADRRALFAFHVASLNGTSQQFKCRKPPR